jgi:O-methyltransferase
MAMEALKLAAKSLFSRVGLEIRPSTPIPEASQADLTMMAEVKPFTMTSVERLWSTLISARYASRNKIPGAFVECGVWRGGQSALAARTFLSENDPRDLWLFDTFAGMTAPTEYDVNFRGERSDKTFKANQRDGYNAWAFASLEDVRQVIARTGYPSDLVHFVKGPVEETLRCQWLPDAIAVLRLDTDWYESTRDEMQILYPKLVSRGVLMIDDYGHYAGAKKAVDEYFDALGMYPLLQPIDYSGRIFIKP